MKIEIYKRNSIRPTSTNEFKTSLDTDDSDPGEEQHIIAQSGDAEPTSCCGINWVSGCALGCALAGDSESSLTGITGAAGVAVLPTTVSASAGGGLVLTECGESLCELCGRDDASECTCRLDVFDVSAET